MPRGVRDTRSWYRDADPMSQVDPALVEFVAARAGRRVLDLGCGPGGYTKTLSDRGFEARGLDVSEEYVEIARGLGVTADAYDGGRIPLDDGAVDTVILIEVIEHLEDPGAVLAEARAGGGLERARDHAQLHPGLRARADRVQPHARRRPPPVLHRGLAHASCWRRGSTAARWSRATRSTR